VYAARTAVLLVLLATAGCADDARMDQDGGAPEEAAGIYETECWSHYSSSEQLVAALSVHMTLIMVEALELDGRTDFIEHNENGTFTFGSFRVRIDSVTTLDGSAWEPDGVVIAPDPGNIRYEDSNGNVSTSRPCSATDPTVINQLIGLSGRPAALVLERFDAQDVYFVRAALGYDPEAATVAPSDGDISLEELKQRVMTARNE
jgi:hypothetical protein